MDFHFQKKSLVLQVVHEEGLNKTMYCFQRLFSLTELTEDDMSVA